MGLKASIFPVAVAVAAFAAVPAMANTLTFQGVTFNTTAVDSDTLELGILNATSATGNWTGINYLKAFEVKDIGTVTAASITSGPGFSNGVNNELNANAGCQGGGGGFCFTGSAILLTSSMTWKIDYTGTGLDFSAPSLKVQFLTNLTDTKATGDLLSQTLPVPEPETYAMLAAGLGLMGFIGNRRKQRTL